MSVSRSRLLMVHLAGYCHVFLHVLAFSILLGWGLQALAVLNGEIYDWTTVFVHLFLSFSILVFFPGQQIWTYRLKDRDGAMHTIVGRTPDQDIQHD